MNYTKKTPTTHIKDKKITIMTHINTQDNSGFISQSFTPLQNGENIWAYYRHATSVEFYAAKTLNSKIECIFEINWRSDVKTSMKIKYKNELYDISKIDDYEGYKDNLKIYAYKIN